MMKEKYSTQKIGTLSGHKDSIFTLCGSHDSNYFFSAGADGMVVLWDLRTPDSGRVIAKLPNSVYALHYLMDRRLLVIGNNMSGIHLLDWENKKEVGSVAFTDSLIFDIVSHDNRLYVGDKKGIITVIDANELRIIQKVKLGEKSIRTMDINPKSGEMAVGLSDNSIKILSLEDMRVKKDYIAHQNSVFTVKFTSDYKFLLSGGRDARLKLWDVEGDFQLKNEVKAHMYTINHIEFSEDGKHFVTCSLDKSLKIWETEGFQLKKVIDKAKYEGHGNSVNKILWSSFNNYIISASDDRSIMLWDVQV